MKFIIRTITENHDRKRIEEIEAHNLSVAVKRFFSGWTSSQGKWATNGKKENQIKIKKDETLQIEVYRKE